MEIKINTYYQALKAYNVLAKAVGIREKKHGDFITSNELNYVFKRFIGFDDSDIYEVPLLSDKDSD